MANPIKGLDMRHEHHLAGISSAGIRILAQGSVSPAAGAEASYTITQEPTSRLFVYPTHNNTGEIRVDQNAAAVAGSFPMLPKRMVSFSVEKDDTVSFFNTSTAAITVYVVEIR